MPEQDNQENGHKYPFNACEILCSTNGINIEKLVEIAKTKNKEKFADNNSNSSIINNQDKDEKIIEKLYDKKDIEKNKTDYTYVFEILDHFFTFFEHEDSVNNSVLLGYFNKIANYLIKSNPVIILNYCFSVRKNVIYKLVKFINKYSLGNTLLTILSALSETDTVQNSTEYFISIINQLIESMSTNDTSIESICGLLINSVIYNNNIYLARIIEISIIDKFHEIVRKNIAQGENNRNILTSIMSLLTKINNSILGNFPKKITDTLNLDDSKIEAYNYLKLNDRSNSFFIDFNIRTITPNEFLKSYEHNFVHFCLELKKIFLIISNDLISKKDDINKLGSRQISIFEFIISVIDLYINTLGIFLDNPNIELINNYLAEISNTRIFTLMTEYYFKFRSNNIYQNIIVQLIKIIINKKSPEKLISNVLSLNNGDNNFILLLINDIVKNTKYTFPNTKNQSNSLLFSSNVTILNYIFTSKNKYIINILSFLPKSKFFYDKFIINVSELFSRKLSNDNDNILNSKEMLDPSDPRYESINNQSSTEFSFSFFTFNEIIEFDLSIYDKYIKGEDYNDLINAHIELLKKRKNNDDHLHLALTEEENEESEDGDYEDIPTPIFFNSKLESQQKNDNGKNEGNGDKNIDNKNKNEENEETKNIKENKEYNDINYWHVEFNNIQLESILDEL